MLPNRFRSAVLPTADRCTEAEEAEKEEEVVVVSGVVVVVVVGRTVTKRVVALVSVSRSFVVAGKLDDLVYFNTDERHQDGQGPTPCRRWHEKVLSSPCLYSATPAAAKSCRQVPQFLSPFVSDVIGASPRFARQPSTSLPCRRRQF